MLKRQKQVKTSKRKKHESKVSERLEDDGVDYEEELNKSKQMEIKLRKGNKLACKEHDNLNRKRRMFRNKRHKKRNWS